jgi:hypothetical protein
MTAHDYQAQTLDIRIEQAIARGDRDLFIAKQLGCTIEHVRERRRYLDWIAGHVDSSDLFGRRS